MFGTYGEIYVIPKFLVDGIRKAKVWQRVVIPLDTLVPPGSSLTSIAFNNIGDLAHTYWINDISLLEAP